MKTSAPITVRIAQRVAHSVSRRATAFWMRRSLAHAGVPHAGGIRSFTTEPELQALYALAAACPPGALALEIGAYLGASTCYLAAGLAQVEGHLLCVDTWQNETMPGGIRDTFAEYQKNIAGLASRITALRKRSDELNDRDIAAPLSLAFIDGDHSYPACKHDFEFVANRLAEGGVVAFHDCEAFAGVSRVIAEALMTGRWKVAGHVNNLLWIKRESLWAG